MMSTREWQRTTAEARRAAGNSTAPVSPLEAALNRYVRANAYGSAVPAVSTIADQAAPSTEPFGYSASTGSSAACGLVVVGIDGSGCARHAAEWAAEEAVRRQAGLRLVYAYHLPSAGASGFNPYRAQELADLRVAGTAILTDTSDSLQRRHPDLQISSLLSYGDAMTVLRHTSATAALTVLGTHGGNQFKVALGSVAAGVAATSLSPVAVIHPGSSNHTGPVVVGVGGSASSKSAAAYAFRVAADRNATLVAVRCWTDPSLGGPVPAYSVAFFDPAVIRAEEQRRLTIELADLVAQYPDVHVEQAVVHARPAQGLLGFAGSAQLIVTGNRGHRGLTGLLLGSTSQALISHSTCPVVIARTVIGD